MTMDTLDQLNERELRFADKLSSKKKFHVLEGVLMNFL